MLSLVQGKVRLDAILGENKGFEETLLDIGHENADLSKKAADDNQSRILPGVVLNFSRLKNTLGLSNYLDIPLAQRLNTINFVIRPEGSRRLIVPDDISRFFSRAYKARIVDTQKYKPNQSFTQS